MSSTPLSGSPLAFGHLLSLKDVTAITGYSRSSIYRLIKQGDFPQPLKLGKSKIAFRECEIRDWLASLVRAL